MSDVNKMILVGRLGKDPEARVTPTGKHVVHFPLATTRKFRERNGDAPTDQEVPLREETQWHKVIVWQNLADNCAQYLKKGATVYVEGMLRERNFDGTDGIKRRVYEVHADTVNFLGSNPRRSAEETVMEAAE